MYLSGCAALPPEAFRDGVPEMRPEVFFAGPTTSAGVLENRSGEPTSRFHVEGNGRTLPDGAFELVQRVEFEGKSPTSRTWSLRKLDDHRYEGTLTDADGSVRAEAYGNLFHLTYAMKEPPFGRMQQWLYLQPDGRTVVNEATVTVLGVTAARLSERITH